MVPVPSPHDHIRGEQKVTMDAASVAEDVDQMEGGGDAKETSSL